MIRALVIFLSCFAVGAVLALVARAAWHHPDAGMVAMPASPQELGSGDAPAEHVHHHEPAQSPPPSAPPAETGQARDGATQAPPTVAAPGAKPINTICPVCGFEVDQGLPVSLYKGKPIGFGCLTNRCKIKFDADPERYGPAALANKKAE